MNIDNFPDMELFGNELIILLYVYASMDAFTFNFCSLIPQKLTHVHWYV